MTRVTDKTKTNTQLFLDKLWKQSDKGEKTVSITVGDLDQDYKYIVKAYLIYLQKIGCIAYNCFGDHYLVAVKRKEVVQ
ncbi:hypothetical protein ACXO65_06620 [Lactobacillus delbrueckii subsp. bulgaricus]|nr:hypothetical protein [Lactobacillus delbrueckii subsp. bulgaricus]